MFERATCSVSWFSDSVMEFVYRGKITVEDLSDLVKEAQRMTDERVPRVQLVDTLAVTGVPPEIGNILNQLLESYRMAGGEVVVMIASDQLTQMLGRSMSFGAGLKLKLFRDRAAALTFVEELTA